MDFYSIIDHLADHEVYGRNLSKDDILKIRTELRLTRHPSEIDQLIRQRINILHFRCRVIENELNTIGSAWIGILSVQDVELLWRVARKVDISADRIRINMINVCTFYTYGTFNIRWRHDNCDRNYELACDLNANTIMEIFNIVENCPVYPERALARYIRPVDIFLQDYPFFIP